ncbi:hypothetical protein Atai01_37140 [Amycolatopsis taiwanensis]|uniref:Uncharacterized protein n=1 Tax=Amycolatopsis taiwanensis TaxID=342230 RepID=A0A9W6R2B5_9PSEU|nr:hypothetical protein Atai01_37140 [Amycolatopsis taiwanensis]
MRACTRSTLASGNGNRCAGPRSTVTVSDPATRRRALRTNGSCGSTPVTDFALFAKWGK